MKHLSLIVSLAACVLTHAASANPATVTTVTEGAYVIDGLVGQQPAQICWLIKRLNSPEAKTTTITKNRLILHGPPGNGKTTLAHKIAEQTNSRLFQLDGPTIVERYVGQGAQNVAEFFSAIYNTVSETHQRVIAFIDEIDAIAGNNKTEMRSEHEAALQQLWLELDKCKNNPLIFVIFATNHLERLDKTFLDRFGSNVIEIKNPDASTRRKVLEHYFSKANIYLKQEMLDSLVKKTDQLSIRCLEDLSSDIQLATEMEQGDSEVIIWRTLEITKKKFTHISDEERERRIQKLATWVSIGGGILGALINSTHLWDLLCLKTGHYQWMFFPQPSFSPAQ